MLFRYYIDDLGYWEKLNKLTLLNNEIIIFFLRKGFV